MGRFKQGIKNYWNNKYLVIMLLPAICYYVLFHYIPMYGVQIAFKDFKITKGIMDSAWIGFDMFKQIFATSSFWEVLSNTCIISLYKLIVGFPAPIILALMFNEVSHLGFKKAVQTISYLPHFLSWVILSGIFTQILSPTTGPVNAVLKSLGMKSIFFLADPKWFRTVLVLTDVWKTVGWGSIIYVATIAGINPALYEAAIVDGASRMKRIIHITIPSLAPVITIMMIFAVGNLLNDNFDQIFNMYNTSVYSVADVIGTYTYRRGMVDMQYSYATAVGLFKNVIAFILILSANAIAKRINEYGIW